MTSSEIPADLLARLRDREPTAWSEFLALRERPLLAFIERQLSDQLRRKVEPGDILQEVGVSLLGAVATLELGDRDPFGWLCQLAERRIVDAHRHHFGAQKRAADREVGLHAGRGDDSAGGGLINMLVASMTTPSQAVARDQRAVKLQEALDKLPNDAREALRLRYVAGLPSKEIATMLGKTDGAIRVLLSRSLTKLQTLLAGDSAFESFQNSPQPE